MNTSQQYQDVLTQFNCDVCKFDLDAAITGCFAFGNGVPITEQPHILIHGSPVSIAPASSGAGSSLFTAPVSPVASAFPSSDTPLSASDPVFPVQLFSLSSHTHSSAPAPVPSTSVRPLVPAAVSPQGVSFCEAESYNGLLLFTFPTNFSSQCIPLMFNWNAETHGLPKHVLYILSASHCTSRNLRTVAKATKYMENDFYWYCVQWDLIYKSCCMKFLRQVQSNPELHC
ncbi:hypothetical protein GYMLUDRAFT_62587 [Collybiopsis luxurians FD-317 M1]|uniref:Uncharacterized protein n=1 Tax=Collybiopsis luxurians FD-317 M1 TaxID=944289 RepID=A0A0D0CB84_9AGAR|nr:hypothetical protein GYMLUDRAFT_62587 [Collybiopsis luxurians FD-317 M1]